MGNKRFGQGKGVAVYAVEALGNIAGQLHMLLLILAHRHQIRLIQQNVRRHQHGVGKQARCNVIGMLLGLGLKLGHAAEFTELGIAAQYPAQLRVLGHMALDEHDILLGVQTAGNILCQLVDAALAQQGRLLTDGNGVHIHDAVQAVKLILQCHPILDGTHIRAQCQFTGGLDAAENPLFLLFHNNDLAFCCLPICMGILYLNTEPYCPSITMLLYLTMFLWEMQRKYAINIDFFPVLNIIYK